MKLQLCDVFGKKVWMPIPEASHRIYVNSPSDAPAGARVKRDGQGRHYYEVGGPEGGGK